MNAPVSLHAPAPALVVISGGPHGQTAPASVQAHEPGFQRLLKSLPPAERVLELNCGEGELARAYKAQHRQTHWVGVDCDLDGIAQARRHMDEALCLYLNHTAVDAVPGRFDLIVVNRLERLPRPDTVLAELAGKLAAGGQLIVLAENHACLSALTHVVEADLSTGTSACSGHGIEAAHPRHQSPSSLYKMMLDAGWMPTLVDHEPDAPMDDRIGAAARYIGEALGVPHGCADRVHRMKHLVIRARRCFDTPVPASTQALFDVVVPTNNDRQLRVNVEQSPGLKEVQARIISYRHAASPAQALEGSLPHVQSDWVLLCHQDVYFPKGFGERLNEVLAAIPPHERAGTLIGFIGMGVNRQTEQYEPAGFVIDRLHMADHAESDAVTSIDELAIVVARESLHRIDPLIGWHLWATDLCLTSVCTHRRFARIVRLPIFHNSQSGMQLPAAFFDSAAYLLQKHAGFSAIHTLCGVIDQGFVANHIGARA